MSSERPIPPEPFEIPGIKKAFRAAKFSRGPAMFVTLGIGAIAFLIGSLSTWVVGWISFFIMQAVFSIITSRMARCPRCGQVWGRGIEPEFLTRGGGLAGIEVNETETFVCRQCRLDIGIGLRE